MFWLLLVVLFQGDPTLTPDTVSHAFATQAQCEAAGQSLLVAMRKDSGGYGSVGLTCQSVSDPRTARSAQAN